MSERKSVRTITINTDASHHHQTKCGGYAFYIVSDLFKIKKSGKFKVNPENSTDAEMYCIINALHTLSIQDLPTVTHLVLNTDCIPCINMIMNPMTQLALKGKGYWDKIIELTEAKNYSIRHVKAHVKGHRTKREGANEWCDQEAKKHMREAVENFKKEKNV